MTQPLTATGQQRIAAAFEAALRQQSAAFMPYFTLGYPDRETSLRVIEAIAPFSNLLELGVPFSDPLADGPTIQRSTQKALTAGTTTAGCLDMVRELRQRGVQAPFMLMGYYNPILAYGEAHYVNDAAKAGADGFIVPDLPLEEADTLDTLAGAAGMALIHMLAPTSHRQRAEKIAQRSRGFLYLVSLVGVTGARNELAPGLGEFVASVRQKTSTPLAVGFGIGTPRQAVEVANVADGIIVGSALVGAVEKAPGHEVEAAVDFVRSIYEALKK